MIPTPSTTALNPAEPIIVTYTDYDGAVLLMLADEHDTNANA